MRIVILGGAGMLGRKLVERLAAIGSLGGRPITGVVLHDVVEPALISAPFPVSAATGDLADPGVAEAAIAGRPELIFHLAAIVSGEAEADFDKGYRVNLHGTLKLFEAIRHAGITPRLVFSSSIGVFRGPFPETITDDFHTVPQTSYGTQKAIDELLLTDYSRRGFFDGVGIRLPTICVRPGKPNKAATGFFSNIIREPLAGHAAVLPVGDEVGMWHASPRAAVGFLIHAASLASGLIGPRRNITMPGVSCTVGDQIAALRAIAGDAVVARIRREPDPTIQRIVSGAAWKFTPKRALDLGFTADRDFAGIIEAHIADELGGRIMA
ncbi:D-erythronate dehydrogenase [Phreatobacter stygius]|uniref:SDR family oxidoreductase n=1 Tax=Phreatobacter stygius TaxID=1940610 RepID=A0A4D7AZE8_9HYPH|nr:D-erythronate dehydrogenase [Phreatobacter stygius]QCI64153.1 SDR family oxidoreductase [Phreatobacter stygius]